VQRLDQLSVNRSLRIVEGKESWEASYPLVRLAPEPGLNPDSAMLG
jgi:hypothetical protein